MLIAYLLPISLICHAMSSPSIMAAGWLITKCFMTPVFLGIAEEQQTGEDSREPATDVRRVSSRYHFMYVHLSSISPAAASTSFSSPCATKRTAGGAPSRRRSRCSSISNGVPFKKCIDYFFHNSFDALQALQSMKEHCLCLWQ